MSSSGRYQSRLLNLISQKSRRFVDQFDRTARHVKVAAAWGVQILLYPVYLMFQATRFAGQQLQQAVHQGWPKLQPASAPPPTEETPTADTPIQQVVHTACTLLSETDQLNALAALTLVTPENISLLSSPHPSPLTPLSPSPLTPLPSPNSSLQQIAIQGVASLLQTRSLVLVTTHNQILDILKPQQQRQLQQRISWEVAHYWRQVRMTENTRQRFTARSGLGIWRLKPPADSAKLLPPVRLFWQVMTWVQTSPVAIAANLFQESSLAITPTTPESSLSFPHVTQLVPRKIVTLLDRTVADWETHPWLSTQAGIHKLLQNLTPITTWTAPLVHQTQVALQRVPTFVTPWTNRQAIAQPQTSADALATPTPDSQAQKIQALIQAAIAYFFGKVPKALGGQWQLPGSTPGLASNNAEEPWLTHQDLFGQPNPARLTALSSPWDETVPDQHGFDPSQPSNLTGSTPVATIALPARPQLRFPFKDTVQHLVQRYLQPVTSLVRQPPSSSELVVTASGPSAVVRSPRKATKPIQTSQSQKSVIRHAKKSLKASVRAIIPPTSATPALRATTFVNAAPDTALTEAPGQVPEPAPNWIETEATAMGYVKHPLEQVLGWLDRAMLWLEERILALWRWLRHR